MHFAQMINLKQNRSMVSLCRFGAKLGRSANVGPGESIFSLSWVQARAREEPAPAQYRSSVGHSGANLGRARIS